MRSRPGLSGARYDGSALGRWTSQDWSAAPQAVPYAKLENPQSLNLYSYVLNNPLSAFDPDGHDCAKNGITCKVQMTQITQKVNFYNSDGNVTSTVSVKTNLTSISDSQTGAQVSVSASATATMVSGLQFNSSQLTSIGSTIGAIQQAGASMSLGADPSHLLTAITAKESTLGVLAPTNPLQLSCSSGKCANGDRSHNIQGALNDLQNKGKRSQFDPASTYSRYNGVPDIQQRATNVENFMNIYNGMSQSTFGFSPNTTPTAPIPPELQ